MLKFLNFAQADFPVEFSAPHEESITEFRHTDYVRFHAFL
jgi:hypothetical protein